MVTWLKGLPAGKLQNVRTGAFDTRMSQEEINAGPFFLKWLINWQGYAAEPIAKALAGVGGRQAVEPAGFLVHGQEGPIHDGEIDRAVAWAKQMTL